MGYLKGSNIATFKVSVTSFIGVWRSGEFYESYNSGQLQPRRPTRLKLQLRRSYFFFILDPVAGFQLRNLGTEFPNLGADILYGRRGFAELFEFFDGALFFVDVGGFVADGFEGSNSELMVGRGLLLFLVLGP